VKTLNRLGLEDDKMLRRHPLGGVVVELMYLSVSFRFHRWAKFGSRLEVFLLLAWGVLIGLLSYTRDLVFANLHLRCLLAGSMLHGSKEEGSRLSRMTTCWVWCDLVVSGASLECGFSIFFCLSLIYFVRGFFITLCQFDFEEVKEE
jgi:hypothetical protein